MTVALALVATILLWASAFVGIRAALLAFGPVELAVIRFSVASVALLLCVPFMRFASIQREDWPRFGVAGAVGIAGYNFLLNFGQREIDAASASMLVNTVPFITCLGAWLLLAERPSRSLFLGMLISFVGVLLTAFARGANPEWATGSGLVLAAACSQAIYFLVIRPLLLRYAPLQVTFVVIMIGTVLMLPLGARGPARLGEAPASAVAAAVYLGIGPAALAYFTWSVALSRMSAGYASSFLLLVPIATLGIGWIWLREVPPTLALVGGALIVSGLMVANHEKLVAWLAWRSAGTNERARK